MAIKDMPKTKVTRLFKALDDLIENAEELKLEPEALEEIKNEIEEALVKACVESDPDTFAIFEHEGKLKVNLVENVKAWGFVRLPNGRWADPEARPTGKVLTFSNGGAPPDQSDPPAS